MGQQQLLLILLGIILVGAAIVLALSLINAQSIQSNRAALINDLNHIAAHVYQYRIGAVTTGGNAHTYLGYSIPLKMASNGNGSFSCTTSADEVTFTATSANNPANTITVKIDSNGNFVAASWTYTGDFQ